MKTLINPELKGKELYKFLIENKAQLIAEKKSVLKTCDPVYGHPSVFSDKNKSAFKAAGSETMVPDSNSLRVKVIANTALWVDQAYDCLLPDAPKKSIKERKSMIPHLNGHVHMIEAKVGEVADIYLEDITWTELGVKKAGSTQAVIFETDVMKSYNEKIFNQYKLGKVNQHSIGLQYVKIELAINDEDSEKEYDFWLKYITQIGNPEFAEEAGFFWVVSEYKLLENSSVLFGANSLTPTLSSKNDTLDEPLKSTTNEPSKFDLSAAIKSTSFFN